ncbi:MAG TPA: hypothetical protein VE546_16395 [Streptomyces sp.]|uniref:hypothetical protein n=1 Tax=Streptomyces sp. TaxID=1931 RepID=UPI002D4A291A|nr:hypothetical protein [Streptomyces sp.]HZG05123.1 hypothetical protein [Streptomyces sp.]
MPVLLLSLTGCGEGEKEKREYPIPESLCGVDIDTSLIEPFMPPGKRIYQTEDEAGTIIWSCEVSVDGEDVFRISRDRWEPGWSTRRFAVRHAYVEPEHEATDKSYVYSDRGAVATVRCTEQGGDRDLFLVAKAEENSADEKAMEKFITAYREQFLKGDPCADAR